MVHPRRRTALGLLSLLVAATPAVAALADAEAPSRASPFTAVRWEGELPMVELDGQWYGLESLDGIPRARILDFCKKEHGKRWQKRFSEDLVEVLRAMGHKPGVQVALVLTKDGKTLQRSAAMTEENRRKVWRANRDAPPPAAAGPAPAAGGVPALVAATAAARAKAPRRAYGFESARIVFKYTGSFEGTETLYVAGFGETLVLDRHKKIGRWEKKTSVCKGNACTMIDHDDKRSWTQAIKPADMDLSVMHATDASLGMVGLMRKGSDTVAGKTCALYEKKDGDKLWRSWRWEGIELKIEMKNWFGESYVKEATEVKEGEAIPEALTKVPPGYKTR